MKWFKKKPYSFVEYFQKLSRSKGLNPQLVTIYGFRVGRNLTDESFEADAVKMGFRIRIDPNSNDMWDVNWDEHPGVNCNSMVYISDMVVSKGDVLNE